MIHRAVTKDELKDIEALTEADKVLIEECVGLFSEENNKTDVMRGYLVQLCEEMIIDDSLRGELPGYAASFSEGWDAAFKFGGLGN